MTTILGSDSRLLLLALAFRPRRGRGRFDAEQAVQRDAEEELAADVDQPLEDRVGAVRDPMHGPRVRDLGEGPGGQRQPFVVQPEDQDADVVAVVGLLLLGQEPGPFGQISLRRGAIEEGPGRPRVDGTIPAVDVRLQFGTAPIAADPDPVPAFGVGGDDGEALAHRVPLFCKARVARR